MHRELGEGEREYLHGYDSVEQERLGAQAEYWRERLLLRDISLAPEMRLLEVGCGVGAVLDVLRNAYPGLKVAGIDVEPAQIEQARHRLSDLPAGDLDLRVGDAARMPWPDGSFDRIYGVWILEHVADPVAVLRECRRVLAPGGVLWMNETDYESLLIWPESDAYAYLRDAFRGLFHASGGRPDTGRRMGPWLRAAGFARSRVEAWGYHYYHSPGNDDLRRFIEYVHTFLEPAIPRIAALGYDAERLREGLRSFLGTSGHPDGAASLTVYRGTAVNE